MNISLTPHYSRSFSGYIWRIKLDEYSGKLWFEVRDEADFTVYLFWADVENASDAQILPETPLSWWDSLVHVHADVLCIQQVKDTSNPGPADLKLVSALDLEELGMLSGIIIEEIRGNILAVLREGESLEVQLSEGENVGDFATQIDRPEVYPEEHEYHEIVRSFLHKNGAKDILGPIMYMEKKDIFISYHHRLKDSIQRSLIWIKDDEIILKEVIDEKMSGYSNESFFTFSNYLIFIENRRTVKVHRIGI